MKTIYRLLSTCAGMGYGFPDASFQEAMKLKLDLIAADAGSMDPGPYYLGTGESYAEKPSLKRDFSLMLKGALAQKCPLMIGSCGLAGDTPNLNFMLDVAKEVFEELSVKDLKVAVIDSHVGDDILIGHIDDLVPLGQMPPLTRESITACKKVAQMGIAPFVSALNEGAQVVLAGRACDVAIFAADPVRRGIDPALAYHAGHILECGALACLPGSGSDCLIAEFTDESSVVFTAPNATRKATVYSIAAHSLYEEDHPTLQFYPEGILSFQNTENFSAGERSAGIRNSSFFSRPLSMKIEGSRKAGERFVSLLFCKDLANMPAHYPIYGRNGVETGPVGDKETEIGLLIKAKSNSEEVAKSLLTLWKGFFMHFGYPGRRATAGNLAIPLSPSQITYKDETEEYVSFVIAGTRDPFFQESFDKIKTDISARVDLEYPDLVSQGEVEIMVANSEMPLMYLETIGPTREDALLAHQEELKAVERFIDCDKASLREVYAGEFFVWGVYHLLTNGTVIRDRLFPISLYRCNGSQWDLLKEIKPVYQSVGSDADPSSEKGYAELNTVQPYTHIGQPSEYKRLVDMAQVIRSKNAGINKIVYDIFFNDGKDYEIALHSNIFSREEMAEILDVPVDQMIGVYRADECQAIKISVNRSLVSGSKGDRDVFGAQQHARFLSLLIPVFKVQG
jgi:hypothetical protein